MNKILQTLAAFFNLNFSTIYQPLISKKTMNMIGKVVIYNLTETETAKMTETSKGPKHFLAASSKQLPAVVTSLGENNTLNLRVIADGHPDNDFYKAAVAEGTVEGTYTA